MMALMVSRHLFLAAFLSAVHQVSAANADECEADSLARFPGGWPTLLDTSIYWFGRNDVPTKAVNGEASESYDPTRRTVIFFHGWTGSEGGWTKKCHRMTTLCPDKVCSGVPTNLLDSWINAGWNVGFFYWDQFADEECARDAEQKIWFDKEGDGLRWKSHNVATGAQTSENYLGEAMSVADICVDAFWTALGQFTGPEVRFVGHSLGAQLAVRCASMLHHQNHPAAPQRMALLEPYFTKHHLWLFRCVGKTSFSTDEGVGNFAALATADYAKHLYDSKGVVTEVYKSSVYTEMSAFGAKDKDLETFSSFVKYKPSWCNHGPLASLTGQLDARHLTCMHYAAIPMYFLSFGQNPPQLDPPFHSQATDPTSALISCPTPSASCNYGQLQQWVKRQVHLEGNYQTWTQVSGFKTLSVTDDTYRLTPSDDQANHFVEAAVSESEWKTQASGSLFAVATAVVPRAMLLLMVLFLCVAGKFLVGRFHLGGPGGTDDEEENDGDARVSPSFWKAQKGKGQYEMLA